MGRVRRDGNGRFYFLLALPSLAVLILVFLLPLAFNLSRAFFVDGGFTLSLVKEAFTDGYTWRLLSFTLLQAFLSSLVSVLVAIPGAYLWANYRFRLKGLMLSLSSLCFTLPSILVVLGFVIFYGNSGFVNSLWRALTGQDEPIRILYSFRAIILAHAFLNIPVALNLITGAWSSFPRTLENASHTLGAGRVRTFLSVTLPRLRATILSASLLIFLFCFTSFSIILVLGGGPQYTTLEVEIYRTNNIVLDSAKASALSLFSFCVNIIIVLLYVLASRSEEGKERAADRAVKATKLRTRLALFLYNTLMLIFILGPLASIVTRSFISTSKRYGEGFSTRAYQELFGLTRSIGAMGEAFTALLNSLAIALVVALCSSILALFLSLYIARRRSRLTELVGMFPLAVSSVTLGLGYYIIKASIGASSVLVGAITVILAHLVIALPFAVRTLVPAVRMNGERTVQAAYTLGAGRMKALLTVEIPALRGAIMRAFIFSFALSVGEVNATLTLAEGKVVTLPILLYRLINSYNYQGACAIGTLLILMTLVVFAISQAIGDGRRKADGKA